LASISAAERDEWDEVVGAEGLWAHRQEGLARDRARRTAADLKAFKLRGLGGKKRAPRQKRIAPDREGFHVESLAQRAPREFEIKKARRNRLATGTEIQDKRYRKFKAGISVLAPEPWAVHKVKPVKPGRVNKGRPGMISKLLRKWKNTHELPSLSLDEVLTWAPEKLNGMFQKRLRMFVEVARKAALPREIIEQLLIRGGVEEDPGPKCPNCGKNVKGVVVKQSLICPLCPMTLIRQRKTHLKKEGTYFGYHQDAYDDDASNAGFKPGDKCAVKIVAAALDEPSFFEEAHLAQACPTPDGSDADLDCIPTPDGPAPLPPVAQKGGVSPPAPVLPGKPGPAPVAPPAATPSARNPLANVNVLLDGMNLTQAQTRNAFLRAHGVKPGGIISWAVRCASVLFPITSRSHVVAYDVAANGKDAIDHRIVSDRNVDETRQDVRVVDIEGPKYPLFTALCGIVRVVAPVVSLACSIFGPGWLRPTAAVCTLTSTAAVLCGTRLFDHDQTDTVTYVPHMVSALVREYSFAQNDETQVVNTVSVKARRLATLPLPDKDNVKMAVGSQLAAVTVLTDPDFFGQAAVCGPATLIPQIATYSPWVLGFQKFPWQGPIRNYCRPVLPTSKSRRCVVIAGLCFAGCLLALSLGLRLYALIQMIRILSGVASRKGSFPICRYLRSLIWQDSKNLCETVWQESLASQSIPSKSGLTPVTDTMSSVSSNYEKLTSLFEAVFRRGGSVST